MFKCYESDLFGWIIFRLKRKVLYTLPEWGEVDLHEKTEIQNFLALNNSALLYLFIISHLPKWIWGDLENVGKQNIIKPGGKGNKHRKKYIRQRQGLNIAA